MIKIPEIEMQCNTCGDRFTTCLSHYFARSLRHYQTASIRGNKESCRSCGKMLKSPEAELFFQPREGEDGDQLEFVVHLDLGWVRRTYREIVEQNPSREQVAKIDDAIKASIHKFEKFPPLLLTQKMRTVDQDWLTKRDRDAQEALLKALNDQQNQTIERVVNEVFAAVHSPAAWMFWLTAISTMINMAVGANSLITGKPFFEWIREGTSQIERNDDDFLDELKKKHGDGIVDQPNWDSPSYDT